MPRPLRAALAAAVLSLPAMAGAQTAVRGSDAFLAYAGTRTGSALLTGGSYGPAFTVAWDITPTVGGFLYRYTFSGFSGPGVGHVLVGLGASCAATSSCVQDAAAARELASAGIAPEIGSWLPGANGASNAGLGGALFGAKLSRPGTVDGGSGIVFSFLSDRQPVWGDLYVKGGSGSWAQNAGVRVDDGQAVDVQQWIARPDTQSVVPEPGVLALVGTGLVGVGAFALRRRRS